MVPQLRTVFAQLGCGATTTDDSQVDIELRRERYGRFARRAVAKTTVTPCATASSIARRLASDTTPSSEASVPSMSTATILISSKG